MKYLIVDDSKIMRETIIRTLLRNGNVFKECEDGDEAIKTYSEFLPDWVLMDIKMQRIDGLKATKEIKKNHPDAKIIIVTNYGGSAFQKAAIEAGANAFISKNSLYELNKYL